ncbi:MAG: AMP-binding protein [Clostridia bacterium]|nr:AMP-binding protein [Clostridia bacterium]
MLELYKKYCRESYDANGVLTEFTPLPTPDFNFAYDVVDEIAAKTPDARALAWCDENGAARDFTFAEISALSNKAANVFLSHGIGKGDMVMLILKRHYQFWYTILALHKIGAIVVPATNLLTKKDLEYRYSAASIKAVVCTSSAEVPKHVRDAVPASPSVTHLFCVNGCADGFIDFDKEVAVASDRLDRIPTAATDPMLMYFTSGTTGHPKMVLHDFTYPIGHIITAKNWQCVKPGGLHFTVAETGWGKAVWGKLYGQWFMECAVFVYDFGKFVPHDVLTKIAEYGVTTFCAPPTIYRFFIKEGLDKYDLSSLTHATTAGEALNPEVFKRFKEYTGLSLMEGFGQTETTLIAATLQGTAPKPGSMGLPSPLYKLSIVNDAGNPVAMGETGEIVIQADKNQQIGLFCGYYRNDEKTDEVWYDGYYHTGDTAWRDEDGYLWFVGRRDDVIKASGYRIGPFEIESVIMELPYVLECAVTGADDPIRGTVVKATIVLTKGCVGTDALKKEIQDYVKKQTAPYKYPRIVEFTDELPKTISGKIRRVEIRQKEE